MANDFLPFCGTTTGSNLLTQSEYVADAQRPIGNQPGIARSKLVNKALRQSAWIASEFAKFLNVRTGDDVLDDQNSTNLQATINKALPNIGAAYSGYHDSSCPWATTSNTYTDFTPSGTAVLTQRVSSGISGVTTAAGNLPGITFTPASTTAVYIIKASCVVSITNTVGNNASGSIRLYDGTTEIVRGNDIFKGAQIGILMTSVTMEGLYIPGTVSPVTVKVQGLVGGDPGYNMDLQYVGSAIEWMLLRIK